MSTSLHQGLRRLSGRVLAVLLSSACLPLCVVAQIPSVLPTSVTAVPHNESYGAPWQTAVSSHGDFVLLDFQTGGLYEYPVNGAPEVTIAAPNSPIGGFDDSGVAIDPRNNNLYVDDNYNNGLLLFPYDTATGMWDLPSQQVATSLGGNLGGSCGNYFQSAGLAINASGLMAVATENGCGVEIFTVPIDTSGNFGDAVPIVSTMSARAKTVTIDSAGNIAFNEDAGGLTGVLFIPAGMNNLANDKSVARVDPNLTAVQGVTIDYAGNLYIADGTAGEVFVPLESGVPIPGASFVISTAPASGGPAFDVSHEILYVPTSVFNKIKDLVAIHLFEGEAGASPVGTAVTSSVTFGFNATTTPYSFVVLEKNGSGDFTLGSLSGCGITTANNVTSTTTYAAASSCTLPFTFTPHTLGDASATLLMEDAKGNILATTVLHGVGRASQADVFPAMETTLGSGLKTPSQIATDASGDIYVADSGLGKVLEFPQGGTASVSIGTGLTAPTGVAVDGAGDVFIADSGSVQEVPNGASGLKASSLKSGLGTHLKLAIDAIGDLFISDPDNQRIVQIRDVLGSANEYDIATAAQLSAIAVSGSGNLYAAVGPNLVQYSAAGDNQTILTISSGATGMAVDASGSVYVTQAGDTIRIPNVNGVLNAGGQVALATSVANPTSVATDALGNAYVTDGAAGDIDVVSTSGFLNLGTLQTTTSTADGNVTVVSAGNLPVNITGFTSTADYSETSTTCVGSAVAVGTSCSATISFSPGPGDQGTLPGSIAVQSDAVNPSSVNLTGVGVKLATSTATLAQSTPPIAGKVTFIVTVASSPAGGVTPTGTVTVSVTGKDAAGVALVAPVLATETLNAGVATFALPQLETGSYIFAATYNGDRVYGRVTTSPAVTVATGMVTMTQPVASQVPQYVLSKGPGSYEPTDNSTDVLDYVYPVEITATSGNPLVGVPSYNNVNVLQGINYGSVTFEIAGGTSPCAATAVNSDGSVLFPTSCLPIDTSNNETPNISSTYTLTPVFASSDYASVTGQPFTLTALAHPVVVISSSTPTLSVTAGTPAAATLTLTSLLGFGTAGALRTNNGNNYALPVALSCDGLPAHATCSFTYPNPDPSDLNSVDVLPTAPGTVVMTVNTNVAVGTSAGLEGHSGMVAFTVMFNLGLFGLLLGKKRSLRQRLPAVFCLLLFCGALVGMSGCSTSNIGEPATLTSPAGTYTVSISAKQVGSVVVPGSSVGTTTTVYGSGNLMSLPFTVSVTVH